MKTNIEEFSNTLISKLKLSIPVNVERVAKSFCVQIKKTPNKDFSGLLFRKDTVAFMAISNSESPVRQRFTIAHELGHFFLHQDEKTFIEYRKTSGNEIKSRKEREANQFAASLLMPQIFLERDIKSLPGEFILENEVSYLAKKYNVSEESMTFRLINLNLLRK
jgi:Zn-dependent peptidase ImmA (M78 family)